MKVAVVAEFYPSRRDPVLGVWAHRQALAARDAGAEVRVLVLHRLVPPRAALREGPDALARELGARVREPRSQTLDGLQVSYVSYASPPRGRSYASWGAWAAPALGLALRRLRRIVRIRARARPQRGARGRCGAQGARGRAAGGLGAWR